MKADEEQKPTEGQSQAKKPRFRIEKLEERIAPRRCSRAGCYTGPKDCPPGWVKSGKCY